MDEYHCYILNSEWKVSGRKSIRCESDAQALSEACKPEQWSENFPMVEVWCGSRLVGRAKLDSAP